LSKQQKAGRPRSEDPMVHTALVLPRDLIERLKEDAQKSNRGLSTEIRQRLQMSYERAPDPRTRNLVECIKELADSLDRDIGAKWYQHEPTLDAFRAGITALLDLSKKGETPNDFDPFIGGHPDDQPPQVIGQTHARLIWRARRGGVRQAT
jgi:hypothetical protein